LDGFNIDIGDGVDAEIWTVTGNAKGYLLTGSIQPFALFGVGAMKVKAEDKRGLGLSFSETDLALRFGAGVDFYFSQRIAVDLIADYVYPTDDLRDPRFHYVSVRVGVKYRF
jgi:opacity protein-like surface antigen